MDDAPKHIVAGTVGFFATLGLSEINTIASICAGFGTAIYMAICIYKKLNNK